MSGTTSSSPCPNCNEEMSTYTDWKPFDTVFGECLNCGFTYYTVCEQMNLKRINELRAEQNANYKNEKGYTPYKPMTKKEFKQHKEEITKNF